MLFKKNTWNWKVAAWMSACLAFGVLCSVVSGSLAWVIVIPLTIGAPVSLAIILGNIDIHTRRHCGFCGYDRADFSPEKLCPECGKPGDIADAPGHKALGLRQIPWWIWLPGICAIPSMMILAYLLNPEHLFAVTIAAIVGLIGSGAYHAYQQVR